MSDNKIYATNGLLISKVVLNMLMMMNLDVLNDIPTFNDTRIILEQF